jgi:apolipoprotein N-acyltransferase
VLKGLRDAAIVVLLYLLAYRLPAPSGRGYPEIAAAFLLPTAIFLAVGRKRSLGWIYLGILGGILGIFAWVPEVVRTKGGLPVPLALLAGLLFFGYEALGWLGVVALARAARRRGILAAAFAAALGVVLWEACVWHIYDMSPGAALGAVPWTARIAAFLGTHGIAALLWGLGAWTGFQAAEGAHPRRVLAGPALFLALLGLGAWGWRLLPRGPRRELDVVMVQPNFDVGLRQPRMEEDLWQRTDEAMAEAGLPQSGCATLVLWPESSVLGRDDRQPSPRLAWEAQRRGVAWLYGTEGGPYNLLRGEAAGQPPFLQAKVALMPFGERNPGPAPLRRWLDAQMGIVSQEPGTLGPGSSFTFPTPQGPLKVHPLLCSEALLEDRVAEGLHAAGGELLTNHTNDGWFDRSVATDLHAAQIRLRAVEAGLPLVRATLTGKSGLFREDGSWVLWGEPMTESTHAIHLTWSPIRTPARWRWLTLGLLAALTAGLGACGLKRVSAS